MAIAVGGKNLFYYLPLTIAERRNYFKDEGLDVEISDFAGGSQALKAAVGGSADVVSGAFEHTLLLQAQKQSFREFVLQGRAPQIVLAVSKKTMPNYKSIADLRGKKIGVTAPGSSTSIMASFVLAKGGLTAKDVAFIGVGAGAGAIAALQSGQIDALANLDPVMTKLERTRRHSYRLRHAHAGRYAQRIRRRHAGRLPVCVAKLHHEESEHHAGADQCNGACAEVAADGDRHQS